MAAGGSATAGGPTTSARPDHAALEVRDLRVRYRSIDDHGPDVLAVDGIDLTMDRGEVLSLVGESGSGKSATLLALAGLLPANASVSGSVRLQGHDILALPERARARVRGRGIGMVFQDPGGSLTPVLTVGSLIDEVLLVHRGLQGAAARAETEALLARCGVGDPARRAQAYPHQLSGGLRQRVAIAAALAAGPEVILADEPTTALDATVQAQVLDLLVGLVADEGVALVLVTHDLAVAAAVADRIAVMYAGRIAEERPAGELMERPGHPYTVALRAAALPFRPRDRDGEGIQERLPELRGRMAAAGGTGCSFAPRCPLATDHCRLVAPPLEPFEGGLVACWRAGELAEWPGVESPEVEPEVPLAAIEPQAVGWPGQGA
ncbi:MAG: ABC transporter ATP-binding protein [Chloroflexi bacterium]|nr:ABC transporter ATP-binding protein [Chloroflexota bacterium]